MSDNHSSKAVHRVSHHPQEGHHQPVDQMQQMQHQTTETLQSCVRELQTFGGGVVKGTIDAGIERCKKDPVGVLKEGAIAAGVGAAAALVLPELAIGAGVVGLGYIACDQLGANHAKRNKELGDAFNYSWSHNDAKQLKHQQDVVAKDLGQDGFHFVLDGTCGLTGGGVASMAKGAFAEPLVLTSPYVEQAGNRPGIAAMQRYVDGDSNALRSGMLSNALKAQKQIKLESASKPLETSKGLGDYVTEATREPKTGLPEHKF